MNIYYLFVFIFSLSLPIFAQQVEEVKNFKPFMIGHEFEGCPENSVCSKNTGKLRLQWKELIKRADTKRIVKFQESNGIPFGVWSKTKDEKTNGLVLWNSKCSHHNTKEKKIFQGEIFLKNVKDLNRVEHLSSRSAFIQYPKGLKKFIIPRADTPVAITPKGLHFNLEMDGEYYAMKVKLNGKVAYSKRIISENFPENIKCPKELEEAYVKTQDKEIYQGYNCKSIYDISAKKFRPMIYGWSCH